MPTDGLDLMHDVADAVAAALRGVSDLGPSGVRDGQYALDLVADEAALAVLRRAGVGVLSEESGLALVPGRPTIVIDPVDGSTNRSPWHPVVRHVDVPRRRRRPGRRARRQPGLGGAVVGRCAARARGATACASSPSGCTTLPSAVVGISAAPPPAPGWWQFRALGAAALDLCLVAAGVLDGYVDCGVDQHGPWDYLGGMLICQEAGAMVADAGGRDLVVLAHEARRTPVAGATPALHAELLAVRARLP